MQHSKAQGYWISPDGGARSVRMKGGPLFEAFHGIGEGWRRRASGRDLGPDRADLARGYTSAVWAYRCIKLRADALAGVPLVLYDRAGDPIEDHPLVRLLQDVNPLTMNLGDLLRATESAYNIWGTAYWLKMTNRAAPNGNGRQSPGREVRWLTWLNPQTVEPVADSQRGIVGYRQTVGSRTRMFSPEEMVVFRNFDPQDDLGGLSPLSVALSEINAELNAARFVAAFFANDARPAGLLTTDQPLQESEMERTRTWWQKLFQGADNKWKTGIIGGGLRWQTITFPPTDLALAELRAEDRRAICAVFGVPASLAGAWEATTYATAREQKASFYEDTMIPQMDYLAEVLNWSLLRPHYPDLAARGAYLAFDKDSITALRESATDKAARMIQLFEAGVITRNEVRAGLGLTLLPEAEDGFVAEVKSAPSVGAQQAVADQTQEVSSPYGASKALADDLARWERFALRRLKAGKSLRPFKSTAIPAELWWQIAAGLGRATTVDDVKAIFRETAAQDGQEESQEAEHEIAG